MNQPTLFELALVHCFESGNYSQAKFLLIPLSRHVTGDDLKYLHFIRAFVNYRLQLDELSDLDNHYVSQLKESKNESSLRHCQSSKNLSSDSAANQNIQEEIKHCRDCNYVIDSPCVDCIDKNKFSKYEKEQGGSPIKTNNQKSFVGLSDSLSPPYFEHIIILGVQ